MNPVGNDLVWLADPHNVGRSGDRRLLQRILTPAERLLVAVSPDPDFLLWSLWAAKEAAYKALTVQQGQAAFAPSTFVVEFSPTAGTARVVHGERSIPVRWTKGADWVHALAAEDPHEVSVRVERSEDPPSQAVRTLAVSLLAQAGGPGAQVSGRPPRFCVEGVDLEVPLSLSHDGPYVAAALRWTNARQP